MTAVMPARRLPATTASLQPWVEFLAPLLWPDAEVIWPARAETGGIEYGLLQVPRHPLLLIPAGAPDAAAAAIRSYSRGVSSYIKVARASLAGLAAAAPAAIFPRRRLRVAGATATLEGHLRELLGVDDLVVAMTLAGRPRPHKKPVLHLLRASGETLGFAKLGWNEQTRAFVRREMAFLQQEHDYRYLSVPRVVGHSTWRDLEILITSPLDSRQRVAREDALPLRALSEVAHTNGVRRGRLGGTAHWQHVRNRLAAAGPEWRAIVEQLGGRVAATEVELGTWHGDWRQKNLAVADGRLQVWDWEQWADDVPVGFDAVHFLFQTAFWADGASVAEAASYCRDTAQPILDSLGVERAGHDAILHAYLLEVAAGHLVSDDGRGMEVRVAQLCAELQSYLRAAAA